METPVIAALVTATGVVVAAAIALIPRVLEWNDKRSRSINPPTPVPDRVPAPIAPFDSSESAQAVSAAASDSSIRIVGVSASVARTVRELDIADAGSEIEFHIHNPGGKQPKLFVNRSALQQQFDDWAERGCRGQCSVPGRSAKKEASIVFVADDTDELEVQAGWWIWVSKRELQAGLARLGIRTEL